MNKRFTLLMALLCLAVPGKGEDVAVESADAPEAAPRVELVTNHGRIVLELYPDKAPATVENFLTYVDEEFFNGLVFHRVIDGFMIQGGGMDAGMKKKSTRGSIKNEAANGLKNDTGTVAMARTSEPHSASSQFFINLVDNDFLNYRSSTPAGFGYCVFGKVVEGMDVVSAIGKVKTAKSGFQQNVAKEAVVIESVSRVSESS
jgi:cyclophilin family peptidyl-prolyl cis-trans isomerase